MRFGMLWFDDSKRKVDDKVQRAADYFRQKYGEQPTECHVNPHTVAADAPDHVGAVRLVANKTVLPEHYWLGIGDDDLE